MRGHSEDRTRLSWWFPRLFGAGIIYPHDILVPETIIIPYTGDNLINILDKKIPNEFAPLCTRIIKAGDELGWPFFLRTDYLSGKHSWKDTCHIPGPECVAKRVAHLVEESAMADMMGFPTDYWIARKLIPTKPAFFAFHGDMPIVKERRYFVQDSKVVCHHPYWPLEAFDSTCVSVDNWRELLGDMNLENDDEVDLLSKLSSKVGAAIGGAWSIDWLWSEDEGKWYLTDMAEAAQSYHWSGCQSELK
jgi:hypothetical protein